MTTSAADEPTTGARNWLTPFQRVARAYTKLIALMNSVGTLLIFGLMFVICADVIARAVFNAPIRGTNEVVAYTILVAVFLQLAHSLHVGRFARAEMFIEPLNKRRPIVGALYEVIFAGGGMFVFLLICYGVYSTLEKSYARKTFFGVQNDFTILEWPLRAVIFAGAGAVAITYGIIFIRKLYAVTSGLRSRAADAPAGWRNLLVIVLIMGCFAAVAMGDLGKVQIGLLSLAAVLAIVFLGVHIGVGLIIVSFVSIWMMMDQPRIAINTVKLASNSFLHNYFFGVVPLFVLMGLLINESGIGKDTFDVARWMLGKFKGGLGIATVLANAIFAAITGSSIASAAVFTKVATPHMREHGYTAKFAVGTVAGSSVLGMLIPPSLLLIVYALVSEQSVGALFKAAIIPGIILAFAMCAAIVVMAKFWPSYVGVPDKDDVIEENILSAAIKIFPIILLVVAVMGGIYGGIFTAVEAGAVGAAGALIISVAKRRLTFRKLWTVLIETGHTTVSVLFLILAANIYGRMLALSGFPQAVGQFAIDANLGFFGFMAFYIIAVIILGMFLDSISMMLIVLPLVLPVIPTLGGDLIWFGIVTVIAVEMGLLTPPLGISVYVVRSTLDDPSVSLGQIFAGAFPYVVIMLLVTILLIVFPQISMVFL
jgi:tripartite ATP-independent transporter DctM subunit